MYHGWRERLGMRNGSEKSNIAFYRMNSAEIIGL